MAGSAIAATAVVAFLLSLIGCGRSPEPSDKSAAATVSPTSGQASSALGWGGQPSDDEVQKQFSPIYRACIDRSHGITVDMRDCNSAELGRLDIELNSTYAKLLAKLKRDAQESEIEDRTPALQAAERAWIAWREAECAYEAGWETGTAGPLMIEYCFMITTWRRTQELKADLSLPSV